MLRTVLIVTSIAGLMAGCAPRGAPWGTDLQAPRVVLTVGGQHFSSAEESSAPLDACVKAKRLPISVSLAVSDAGGVARVGVGVFPGRLTEVSAAPSSARVDVTRRGSRDELSVIPVPPLGTIQPNVLISFKVSEESALSVSANDTSRNSAHLFQITVRSAGDPVMCRGD